MDDGRWTPRVFHTVAGIPGVWISIAVVCYFFRFFLIHPLSILLLLHVSFCVFLFLLLAPVTDKEGRQVIIYCDKSGGRNAVYPASGVTGEFLDSRTVRCHPLPEREDWHLASCRFSSGVLGW